MKEDGTMQNQLKEVSEAYQYLGDIKSCELYGNGHINTTYLMVYKTTTGEEKKAILQKMNTDIFKNPKELMENIIGVTSYLREKIIERGGDPERETLHVRKTSSGDDYFIDSKGDYWRVYNFVEGATCYDKVETEEDFYQSALAFGNFQSLLAEYKAKTLHETIPQFHDTRKRFNDLKKSIEENASGRVAEVQEEIKFALEREKDADVFGTLLAENKIPLRVTHNDTKLNNIMIDDETRRGICVIDLDTVMPGLAMNDFGDAIRFGANTAMEDETDLSKVSLDLSLFEIYAKGFLEGCKGSLTQKEIELLPMGAKMMTYECGMRFLADHIDGDHYFKIHRKNHNLDRARCQFALVADMEKKWDEMKKIIERLQNK